MSVGVELRSRDRDHTAAVKTALGHAADKITFVSMNPKNEK